MYRAEMTQREKQRRALVLRVVVTEYQAQWPRLYAEEAARLAAVFGDELVAIHHIGSTSVPGLQAKPVIDILPVVRNIAAVDRLNDALIALGYEPMGEYGIPGRRYFRKGPDLRTHHVHVFGVGSHLAIDRHLAVRDYLRADLAAARAYGDLKERLAAQFPADIEAYMDGKDAFVKDLEGKALLWYATHPPAG